MKYQIMIAVFAPLLASFYGLIPPVKGTFRCDDPSIKFKFEGDTVSAKLLFQVILLPIISIVGIHNIAESESNVENVGIHHRGLHVAKPWCPGKIQESRINHSLCLLQVRKGLTL